jgi:hypothetical protein
MTLARGDEHLYHLIRDGITGGLSNVHNRYNIKGESTIKKLKYKYNALDIVDTNNPITHCIGIDFNSLYPSVFSGVKHEFNPYTDGYMYMPGDVKFRTTDHKIAKKIVDERKELFIVSVKGHCKDKQKL